MLGPVSLEELHRTYRASLISYFGRRVPESAISEDLTQQVFERLVRRGKLESIANPGSYIFQTAHRVFMDHLRLRQTRQDTAHESFQDWKHAEADFSPEHVLVKRESLAQAIRILHTLPERTRVIFVLRRIEGVRFSDIAAQLGISVSAVEKHMARAAAHLAREFDA